MADVMTKTDIGSADGYRIVAEAETWKGVRYALIGPSSTKSSGGDCSGTTFRIYGAAGFPYAYQQAENFPAYAVSSGLFREIAPGDPKQDGDILSWSNHMAIFDSFKSDPENGVTMRTNNKKIPFKQVNDMWTASHRGGPAYGPGKMSFFKPHEAPRVFRYQKK